MGYTGLRHIEYSLSIHALKGVYIGVELWNTDDLIRDIGCRGGCGSSIYN